MNIEPKKLDLSSFVIVYEGGRSWLGRTDSEASAAHMTLSPAYRYDFWVTKKDDGAYVPGWRVIPVDFLAGVGAIVVRPSVVIRLAELSDAEKDRFVGMIESADDMKASMRQDQSRIKLASANELPEARH